MDWKTLHEICASTSISRRAIQGYEKAGLVRPDGKNKYGYLLYSKESVERIKKIYFYQQIGFTVREISGVIDADDRTKIKALQNKLELLRKEGERLDILIRQTEKIIKDLL